MMLKFLGRWLKVYRDEIGLFLWSSLLLFLIRSSNILFNNFAETAFLKRFGVEYLPIIYMINSLSTFVIMGLLTGLMARLPGSRLLSYMLVFCGMSVAALRFVIPLGFDLLYPVLFVLKTQYEVLLGLMFWDMANDLFNTRQSKRLFPLITAGGVLGGVIGSFSTPFLARAINLDNLLLVYLGTTVLGAVTVRLMSSRFPTLLLTDEKPKKSRSRPSLKTELQKIWPLIKESTLIKILIILTLMPNVVIPIINFQFNFAVDQTYATESNMIKFFGFFRGFLNIISFVILLFIGRVYGRWGLPVALMFHPFNYILAFLAFLFRFDVVSAMYARISTNVLRTTINNPARAVLVGLFPTTYRSVIRPFLRGTVVRIGVLMGSGVVLLFQGYYHPRFLSVVAIVFVVVWLFSTVVLKRKYSNILLDLISRDMLDLKSLEEKDVSQIFMDKKMRSQLVQGCVSAQGEECLWYANLLRSVEQENLDKHILSALKDQDDNTKIGLLSFLSPKAGPEAVKVLENLADAAKPELMKAVAKTANLLAEGMPSSFYRKILETATNPEVKAYAVIGLYRLAPDRYGSLIDSWLESESLPERRAGVIAAGESRNNRYIDKLREMLDEEEEGSILPYLVAALAHLGAPGINGLVRPYLSHPLESVRLAALEAFDIENDEDLRTTIGLMADPSDHLHDLAIEKLESATDLNIQVLIESLTIPRRRLREGIFRLLESLNIKDVEVFRFARVQLARGYWTLAETEGLRHFPESRDRDLLIEHLGEVRAVALENILRVLATQDHSGQMRIIWRGISSADLRRRSNSIEALEGSLAPTLSKILMPIAEGLSSDQSLAVGRKQFQIARFGSDSQRLFTHLLNLKDWVTVVLALNLLSKSRLSYDEKGIVQPLLDSENRHIRRLAQSVIQGKQERNVSKESDMEKEISIPDKILHLRGIQIFEGLSVGELAAVASVTEEVVYPEGETVIREGETGDTMYLIIEGEVSVLKGKENGEEIELDRIRAGDYFGEMALFEDVNRTATIRTAEASRMLVLNKQEFEEIVREYPQIALHICKVFSQRIRGLHEKIRGSEGAA